MQVKRPRTEKPATLVDPGTRTGRDGAIDLAGKEEAIEREGVSMDDHIYRVIELVGTLETSIDDAVRSAIARAHKTIRNLRWFEIARTSGRIEDGTVRHFQVTLKVGFTMEAPG
jgi:flavin-binding protein dodecin